ncbi:serine/threonine-protein kinase [Nocardiopsis sp. L17-MgMaSL7]|uniref:serine/threonine-protein kinase n=1 Tax=Nocardiopsis sp. L17-MgMaSL7 TaxID=1938893 RepID=UPI000D71B01A|nr:serine/threonine-protein kinase [Nocardiopsis sp. L17-MgMaSL7]PWV57982.1 serine/threonine protein kinase [Nocardiopsis sp. L17-MgMaSL7]
MHPTDPPDPSGPTANLNQPSPRGSVGRYTFLGELGSGAMGTVWRAHDTGLNREVAVKEVHLPHDMPPRERERARARMVREAQAAARVSHPSVVTVHDVLDEGGITYIVMELLDGESLRERLRRAGPLPEAEVERIARPLLGALWAAHRAGVIHRDVKPANIMLSEGGARPVLTDFGIANLPDHEGTALTGTGTILGTAAYAAPERLEDDETSAVSDLWSLGATLFAALAGDSPFKRDTLTSTLTAVLTQPVPQVPARGPVAAVVNGLLVRDPRRRLLPERALALLDSQASGPHAPPVRQAPPVAPPTPPAARPRRSRAPLWIGAAALAALLVMGVLTLPALLNSGYGPDAGSASLEEPAPEPSGDPSDSATDHDPEPSDDAPEGFVRLSDGVVELVMPQDWVVRDGDLQGGGESATRLSSYELGTGEEDATATVIATEYDFLVRDAEGSMVRMEELLQEDEDFSDVRQQRLETEELGAGVRSAVYEVLFRHEERDSPERWMFTREVSDDNRGIAYRISFNFPADLRGDHQDEFQAVIDSFGPDTDED